MRQKDYQSLIKQIYTDHNTYWVSKKEEHRSYADMYSINFWRKQGLRSAEMIQVSDARSYVEAYISSLFSKAPAVRVASDIKASTGSEDIAEAVINRFLEEQEENITNASRLALIFPCSFFKLIVKEQKDILEAISLRVLSPWEIIVDRTAPDWKSQRWVGSISKLTVGQAEEEYNKKDWTPEVLIDFLDTESDPRKKKTNSSLPEDYQYVTIVELYDLVNCQRILYSPNLKNGLIKTEEIPVINGQLLVPIIPIFFNTNPERPLEGFSFMKTIFDPIKEKNLLRSHWAASIRRDARQFTYTEGSIDEEGLARLEEGGDNTFVPVKGDSANVLAAVPTLPMSMNHQTYLNQVEGDLQKANLLASFTRGQSTNVTATEITALAQYTASEVGKLARVRDTAIEEIAAIYLKMLGLLLNDGDQIALIIAGKASILQAKDIEGKFKIVAVDQGSLPALKSAKKQEFMSVLPVLLQLGVDKQKILDHIKELFELPEDLAKLIIAPQTPETGRI